MDQKAQWPNAVMARKKKQGGSQVRKARVEWNYLLRSRPGGLHHHRSKYESEGDLPLAYPTTQIANLSTIPPHLSQPTIVRSHIEWYVDLLWDLVTPYHSVIVDLSCQRSTSLHCACQFTPTTSSASKGLQPSFRSTQAFLLHSGTH